MSTNSSAPARLPSALPVKPRLDIRPFDVNGWTDQDNTAAPHSDHSPADADDACFTRTRNGHIPPTGRRAPRKDVANLRGSTTDGAEDRYTFTWAPHEPHRGRRPPTKGVANFRGSIVDGHGQELVLESTLEKAAAVIGVAFHKKRRMRSQVGPVSHEDDNGKERHSTLDFTLDTGVHHDVAIAVKPGRKVESSGLLATIAAIREQRPDFAGRVEIWTEKQLPRFAEHNADLILRCRRDRRADDIERMKRLADKIDFKIDIRQLIRLSGLWDGRAFVATVNLIDEGFLVAEPHQRFGYSTKVRRAT